jgi:hypothetical protein
MTRILIHNYPPAPMTYSYITTVSVIKGEEVESRPIYVDDLTTEQHALILIIATAEASLINLLNKKK